MKRDVKVRNIILDVVKDHIIPHIFAKDHAFQMWTSSTNLYQSSNEKIKMVLREKLKNVHMIKGEGVASYLTKITQVKDKLAVVGEVIGNVEMVRSALNSVTQQWTVFMQTIIGRENMPTWDRLWDDLTHEETRRGYIQGSLSHHRDDEKNVVLAAKGKKKKFKKGSKDGAKQHDGEKKDMGKVKCFACQKLGHYAGQCPNKKKKKQQIAASAEIDEFAARFERDFSLFAGVSVERVSSITSRDI